jgi:hypothetical protein
MYGTLEGFDSPPSYEYKPIKTEDKMGTTMKTFGKGDNRFYVLLDILRVSYDKAVVKFVATALKRGTNTEVVVDRGTAYVQYRNGVCLETLTIEEKDALSVVKDRFSDIVDHYRSNGVRMDFRLGELGATLRRWDTQSIDNYIKRFGHVAR